jgi:hypothetical protein
MAPRFVSSAQHREESWVRRHHDASVVRLPNTKDVSRPEWKSDGHYGNGYVRVPGGFR